MSIRARTLIECNGPGCSAEFLARTRYAAAAREQAREAGWVRRTAPNGTPRDLCPDCQAAARIAELEGQLRALRGGDGE